MSVYFNVFAMGPKEEPSAVLDVMIVRGHKPTPTVYIGLKDEIYPRFRLSTVGPSGRLTKTFNAAGVHPLTGESASLFSADDLYTEKAYAALMNEPEKREQVFNRVRENAMRLDAARLTGTSNLIPNPSPFEHPGVGVGHISQIVEIARTQEFTVADGKRMRAVTEAERSTFFDRFEKAQVFLFPSVSHTQKEMFSDFSKPKEQRIDLPFPTCYFALLPNDGGAFDAVGRVIESFGIVSVSVAALVHEVSPCLYDIYSLELLTPMPKAGDHSPPVGGSKALIYYPSVKGNETASGMMVMERLTALSQAAIGEERVSQKVRIGTGSRRRFHVIRKVIHVVPKKMRGESQSVRSGSTIKWSHRWHVRGHWRVVEGGIGKNREGQYGVQGFTWILHHTKGPADAPLIADKIRIYEPAGTEGDAT